MKNRKLILFITEIAIFSAIGIIFDLISEYLIPDQWLNGGSIGIAMLPIFLMGYRWGLKGSLTTGLLIGTIQIIYSSYLLNFFQAVMDYTLAYTVVGFAALVWNHIQQKPLWMRIILIIVGSMIGVFLRVIIATLSGYWFWETGLWASFVYNLGYLLPSWIICTIVLVILLNLLPKKFTERKTLK